MVLRPLPSFSFFFNRPAPPEIYTLSLHTLFRSRSSPADAAHSRRAILPSACSSAASARCSRSHSERGFQAILRPDRKSTRLNSSHVEISYAVFCLKKKKKNKIDTDVHAAVTSYH